MAGSVETSRQRCRLIVASCKEELRSLISGAFRLFREFERLEKISAEQPTTREPLREQLDLLASILEIWQNNMSVMRIPEDVTLPGWIAMECGLAPPTAISSPEINWTMAGTGPLTSPPTDVNFVERSFRLSIQKSLFQLVDLTFNAEAESYLESMSPPASRQQESCMFDVKELEKELGLWGPPDDLHNQDHKSSAVIIAEELSTSTFRPIEVAAEATQPPEEDNWDEPVSINANFATASEHTSPNPHSDAHIDQNMASRNDHSASKMKICQNSSTGGQVQLEQKIRAESSLRNDLSSKTSTTLLGVPPVSDRSPAGSGVGTITTSIVGRQTVLRPSFGRGKRRTAAIAMNMNGSGTGTASHTPAMAQAEVGVRLAQMVPTTAVESEGSTLTGNSGLPNGTAVKLKSTKLPSAARPLPQPSYVQQYGSRWANTGANSSDEDDSLPGNNHFQHNRVLVVDVNTPVSEALRSLCGSSNSSPNDNNLVTACIGATGVTLPHRYNSTSLQQESDGSDEDNSKVTVDKYGRPSVPKRSKANQN